MTAPTTDKEMRTRHRLWKRAVLILAGLMIGSVLIGGLALMVFFQPEHYMTHTSPDGRYRLVVYRTPTLFSAPGQGSDAPGHVVLLDDQGRELKTVPIDMVQLATRPEWSKDRVSVKLVLDWDLE
jgi:hypothetical protein